MQLLMHTAHAAMLHTPMRPRYSARKVPEHIFRNGLDGGAQYLFPLEYTRSISSYTKPWEACFGPNERYSLAAIEAGYKLPCKYLYNADGSVDFEEEHACDVLIKANCYCYAVNRFVGRCACAHAPCRHAWCWRGSRRAQ